MIWGVVCPVGNLLPRGPIEPQKGPYRAQKEAPAVGKVFCGTETHAYNTCQTKRRAPEHGRGPIEHVFSTFELLAEVEKAFIKGTSTMFLCAYFCLTCLSCLGFRCTKHFSNSKGLRKQPQTTHGGLLDTNRWLLLLKRTERDLRNICADNSTIQSSNTKHRKHSPLKTNMRRGRLDCIINLNLSKRSGLEWSGRHNHLVRKL